MSQLWRGVLMSSWNKDFEDMTIGELKALHEEYLKLEQIGKWDK